MPKLFPIAERCKETQPDSIVQEDRAGPHEHEIQGVFYDFLGLQRLLWPGNSPDINAIEPCWMYLKRETNKNGAPLTRDEAASRWLRAWNDLPQAMIQRWIRRIPEAIEEIIRLKGGNEYDESVTRRRRRGKGEGSN